MRSVLLLLIFGIILSSCGGENGTAGADKDSQIKAIKEQQEKLQDSKDEDRGKVENAIKLISLYDNFANEFPEHENTPDYLYDAARLSSYVLNDHKQAIDFYEKIAANYPEHNKAPVSMFTAGYLYENLLDNKQRARLHYQKFLEKYPDHDLKKDAEFALRVIDKDPADILKEFKKREAAEEASN